MSLGLGAAIGGGSSLFGSVLNNAFSISSQQRNQRYAREQMNWQENMANTAHQREIADLRAAGLNPILTATGGQGAVTPNGQSGSIASAEASPMDVASAKDILKYFDSQKDEIKSTTAKNKAEEDQTRTLTPVLKNQAESASAKNEADALESLARASEQTRVTDYWKEHPTQYAVNQWINTVGSGLNMLGTAVNTIFSAKGIASKNQLNRVMGANLADLIRARNGN